MGLALFKIFGVAGLSPLEAVAAATAAALAGTKWINLVAVGLMSFWRFEGSTLTLTMPSFLGMDAAETVRPFEVTPFEVRVECTILDGIAGTMLVLSGTILEISSRFSCK